MIGILAIARNVLEASRGIRKHRGKQVVGEHPLKRRRNLSPTAKSRDGERNGCVPTPPRLEHRRIEQCLHEDTGNGRRMQIAKHVGERKRMLRTKRQEQRVIRCGRLELKVELTAESLA